MSDRLHAEAYDAMNAAFAAAEQVELLLDRHYGDSGTDPDMIREWRATLEGLALEIRDALGEPRVRLPGGGLVPRSKA